MAPVEETSTAAGAEVRPTAADLPEPEAEAEGADSVAVVLQAEAEAVGSGAVVLRAPAVAADSMAEASAVSTAEAGELAALRGSRWAPPMAEAPDSVGATASRAASFVVEV